MLQTEQYYENWDYLRTNTYGTHATENGELLIEDMMNKRDWLRQVRSLVAKYVTENN